MAKLIITKGLPRSGKTTWAKEHLEKSGNFVRINRDDLRMMLHNDKWSHQNEKITMKCQDAMVRASLLASKSVIVDDTNLSTRHKERWSQIAKECDATFEVKKFDSTDIQELIDRDCKDLISPRGENVIVKLAMEHGYIRHETDSLILCDLDGTLCDIAERLHFVKGEGKKDWNGFFAGVPNDKLRYDVHAMLKNFVKEGKKIIFVSARPERCRKDTENWLWRHKIESRYGPLIDDGSLIYEALIMRPDGDSRDDTLVKGDMMSRYFWKESIHTVIDDRPAVIRMWKENDVPVIDVGAGIEF